jgi:hypothetical protein
MPTNRKRQARRRESIPLDESIEKYFLTGEAERDTPGWKLRTSRFFDQGAEIERVWQQHKDFLLKKWKSEGRKLKPWMK